MKKHFSFAILFLIIIMVMTFPLVLNLMKYFPAFCSTDEPFAGLWDSWRIKYSLENSFSLRYTSLIAYPFGYDPYSSDYFSYLFLGLFHLLSMLTTHILTWNFQVFLNIFLNGFFTYLLIFYLTQSRLVSFLGGLIFGFCPYQFMRIWQHLGLTYNQWIPLCLLTVILLKGTEQKKYSLLFLISLLLLLSFDFSVMYLGAVSLLTFFIYVIFYQWRTKLFKDRKCMIDNFRYIRQVLLVGVIASVILLPQFFPIIKNRFFLSSSTQPSAFNPYHRPFEDLFVQSAKPLSYILPATTHPLFGGFTEQFIGSQLYGASLTEHTLYLGWIPLVLAFVAFRRWRKNRKSRITSYPAVGWAGEPRATNNEDFYIGFFVFLALVAWLFSQPPWWSIFGFKLYMPSFFMYKILPMFRAYCRFGIVVMLAVAVLAGFGLKFVLERFKSRKTKTAMAALFCALVLFEFWNWPPYKVMDLSKVPAVYYWLKGQPKDIAVAEYPLDSDSPNELYKFFQTVHEKKIINGTILGTYANKVAQEIRCLSESETAANLKWMGVKYVIVHKDDYLKTDLVEDKEDLERIPQSPGLKFVKSFAPQECPDKDIMCVQKSGPIDVYEVVAEVREPRIEK